MRGTAIRGAIHRAQLLWHAGVELSCAMGSPTRGIRASPRFAAGWLHHLRFKGLGGRCHCVQGLARNAGHGQARLPVTQVTQRVCPGARIRSRRSA